MTTDDFLLEQMERTQRHQTRQRRDGRSRRRQVYLFGGLAMVAILILVAPSLVSHSSIGRSILAQTAADYGLEASASSLRVGWITPLRITGLRVRGTSAGSEWTVEQLDTGLTVTDLIGSSRPDLGETVLRGVKVVCEIDEGRCSLEDDLAKFFDAPSDGGSRGSLKLQDVTVSVTDRRSGSVWQIAQSNAAVAMTPELLQATFSGVLSEPGGSGGSLQGMVELGDAKWRLDLESESLPLSVMTLVRRRFPELGRSIPTQVSGDATGTLHLVGASDGAIEAQLRGVQVRNLTASQQGSRLWSNQLATIEGDLILAGNRVIGRGLRATTDFASATIDGAFSRSFSLVGANDNPLRWLEALDGSATAEIDLASLDRALPGLIPLKDDAQLVSGRARGQLNTLPMNGGARRSQLVISSDALRARSRGQAVMIDPIELTAIVSTHQGQLNAEQFEWKSSFATAVGRGDFRSGSANVEIDFGRLTSMLRPIIDISSSTLGGSARGNIRWDASPDNVWRLSGTGNATNLLITMPSGQTLRRPSLRGEVEAVGRWGGQSLDELSKATLTLASSGLDLRADLIRSVTRPSRVAPFPVRLQGSGRLETLVETLLPWMPKDLHDVEGGFQLDAVGDVSAENSRVTSATIGLTSPRIAYIDRYFSQPRVDLVFDGEYAWPSGNLRSRKFELRGDAFSAAAIGVANAQTVDLQVKWRAKLERIQGSVRKQIASRPAATIRQVGYQPGEVVKTDDWLVMGDCEGDLGITKQGDQIVFDTFAIGKNLAIVQPPTASAGFQTVGPMPQRRTGNPTPAANNSSRVVWSEPNLQIDGALSVDQSSGRILADSMKVAGDWFATNLSGHVMWNEVTGDVLLKGPARLKMNEVARVLSKLAGTEIRAEGIQETPLEIQAVRRPDGNLAFSVGGNLGWELGEVAGVQFGPASIPVRLTETSVYVAPSVIPVGQGQLNLAGEVHYRPGMLWMRVQPGVVAQSIRLTPESTNRWLKYVAPLVANTTNIDGTVSAELDEAIIVFEQPELSRVSGRLNIEGAQMTAGPLANQIIGGIDQLKAIARATGGVSDNNRNRTLITMPAQGVDFIVQDGIVSHERLYFEVDRAQVITSGRVGFDGRLDMVAQVPLDARWLGSDLQGLAGQPVSLPIDGTLSSPSLDSRGVRQVVSQLGVQAAQSTAENYLQKQLNRSIDKIFGR